MNQATFDNALDKPFSLLRDGILGGIIAGWIFAIVQMMAAMAAGRPTQLPWEMAASLVRGRGALDGHWTFNLWVTGAAVHFGLSALYGLSWAAIARGLRPYLGTSLGAHSAVAAGFGLLLWVLNFQIVARVRFPWFLSTNTSTQMLLHMVAFGIPLGLYLEARLHDYPVLSHRRLAH